MDSWADKEMPGFLQQFASSPLHLPCVLKLMSLSGAFVNGRSFKKVWASQTLNIAYLPGKSGAQVMIELPRGP